MLGSVVTIARYPVKSMRGEQLAQVEVTRDGVLYDRLYAFESDAAPPGMLRVSGQERRQLLRYAARQGRDGAIVTLPDGRSLPVDDPRLLASLPGFSPTRLTRTEIPQTDCRPVSLIGLPTIAQLGKELGLPLDPRRFRANLYLDLAEAFSEDYLVGKSIRIGLDVELRILERDPRCRFITFDPETLEPLPDLMKLLHAHHQGRAGVYARVEHPGTVRVDDPVSLNAP